MFSRFFIYRPIFASVISIVVVLVGVLSIPLLPVESMPTITPPSVQVTTAYPGAGASVVAESVTAPLVEKINGGENMIYMSSTSSSTGNYTLSVKSDEAGNFTAKVHLVYSRAFGCNGTYSECQQTFYSGINWTTGTPAYATEVTFDGTDWSLTELWWNVGPITLAADTEVALNITCTSLNATWEPDYTYVEVYRAW